MRLLCSRAGCRLSNSKGLVLTVGKDKCLAMTQDSSLIAPLYFTQADGESSLSPFCVRNAPVSYLFSDVIISFCF